MIQASRFPALLEPRLPGRAILAGWLVTTIPAVMLSALVSYLFPHVPGPSFPSDGWRTVTLLVIFAPLIETLIMAAALEIMLLVLPPRGAVLASAIGWGIAHSLKAATWGLVIWWPFLIFSILYVTWREQGRAQAIGIVFAVHALNNLGPALLLLRST